MREWHVGRLPAQLLAQVTAEDIWKAAHRLLEGYRMPNFGNSTDYDLLVDDKRLPPKAVFGLAASQALGFSVLPKHFTAGLGTPCFRALQKAGFRIVRKGDAAETGSLLTVDDREWVEGQPELVHHLRRERAAGAAQAKRQSFIREHGRLFCERCGIDPRSTYGAAVGYACIEVHHRAVPVASMPEMHGTKLEDLECLCANCHRIVHALWRLELVSAAERPNIQRPEIALP